MNTIGHELEAAMEIKDLKLENLNLRLQLNRLLGTPTALPLFVAMIEDETGFGLEWSADSLAIENAIEFSDDSGFKSSSIFEVPVVWFKLEGFAEILKTAMLAAMDHD